MRKKTLSDVLRVRTYFRWLMLIAGLVLIVLTLKIVVVDNPQETKAGVTEVGNTITIDGGSSEKRKYVIDPNGDIYEWPNIPFNDEYNNELDFRYYSYSAKTSSTKTAYNIRNKGLVLRNTTAVIEGSQELNSLNVESTAKVTQPMADREGKINRPLYAGDYWGVRFTGFLAIPKDKGIWLTVDDGDVDDAVMIEVCKKSGGGLGTNIAECNSGSGSYWDMVYKRGDWGSGGYDGVSDVGVFRSGWGEIFSNYGGGADKYVPVRFSFGDKTGDAKIKFRARVYTVTPTQWTGPDSNGALWNGYLYSYSSATGLIDNDNIAADRGHMYFEYYLFNTNSLYANFSNAIKTAYKPYLYLDTDFGGGDGDVDTGGTDRFDFIFQNGSTGNQATSPLGNSIATAYRFLSSRYSAKGLNTNAFDWPQRIDAGLTLDAAGELKISANYGIDLNGVGYPGWAKEFIVSDAGSDGVFNVGAGPGGGSSVGQNNTGKVGVGGGGWHAGRGGMYKLGSGDNADNRITIAASTVYGDGSDYLNAYSIGSGGGASLWDGDYSDYATVGGSGGGALSIRAGSVVIEAGNAITANGDSGFGVGSNPTPAGSGGAGGKIVVSTANFNTNPSSLSGLASVNGGSKAGFSSPLRFSGGGGGFVNLAYTATNNDFIKNNQPFDVFKADGGAGESTCEYNPDNNPYNLSCNGDRGSIAAVKRGSSEVAAASIKKQLAAISVKSGNPYSLQIGDRIRVELRMTGLVVGQEATIDDEILKVFGSNYKCGKDVAYAWDGTEGTGGSRIGIAYISNQSPPLVRWIFSPSSDLAYLYYDCTIE